MFPPFLSLKLVNCCRDCYSSFSVSQRVDPILKAPHFLTTTGVVGACANGSSPERRRRDALQVHVSPYRGRRPGTASEASDGSVKSVADFFARDRLLVQLGHRPPTGHPPRAVAPVRVDAIHEANSPPSENSSVSTLAGLPRTPQAPLHHGFGEFFLVLKYSRIAYRHLSCLGDVRQIVSRKPRPYASFVAVSISRVRLSGCAVRYSPTRRVSI